MVRIKIVYRNQECWRLISIFFSVINEKNIQFFIITIEKKNVKE